MWFADFEKQHYEKMKLLDALEITISPGGLESGRVIDFDWDILGYNDSRIWLQLYI